MYTRIHFWIFRPFPVLASSVKFFQPIHVWKRRKAGTQENQVEAEGYLPGNPQSRELHRRIPRIRSSSIRCNRERMAGKEG